MARTNGTPESDLDEALETTKANIKGAFASVGIFDFFASAETTTVYLDDDNRRNDPSARIWVRLLNELDFGQQSELDAASIRGVTMQDAQDAVAQGRLMVFDLGHQRRLKLAVYIDDWNLPHKWPAKLDERYQLVKRLKPRWATLIMEQIERLEAEALGDVPQTVGDSDPNVMILPSRAVESAAT